MLSKITYFVVILMVLFGAWSIFSGLYFGGSEEMMRRYVGGRNPGYYIDRGIYTLLCALALTLLAKNNAAVSANKKQEKVEVQN